ncbi:MAG: hypothetical protein PUP92_16005 [Rhizonema sp. PD38]|nr:hypothetical protein [Rhizonema sp. PD38]
MSALVNQTQFDVEFASLNNLAKNLRIAGAKFSVRRVGQKHRITVLQKPGIALEEIINYTIGKIRDSIDTPSQPSDVQREETTDTPNSHELAVPLEFEAPQELVIAPALASSTELLSLTLEKLKKLAKLHKIIGFSKLKRETLASKLEGLVTKEQLV